MGQNRFGSGRATHFSLFHWGLGCSLAICWPVPSLNGTLANGPLSVAFGGECRKAGVFGRLCRAKSRYGSFRNIAGCFPFARQSLSSQPHQKNNGESGMSSHKERFALLPCKTCPSTRKKRRHTHTTQNKTRVAALLDPFLRTNVESLD